MKRSLFVTGLGLAMVCGFIASTTAAPLELKHVSADAKWLGHIDFDAVRDSTVVQKLYKKAMEKHKGAEGQLSMATQLIGFDPRKDLHGATFYGKEIAPHKGVMILNAKMDVSKLKGWADKVPKRETTKYGDREIMSWTHEHHGHKHTIAASFYGDDRLLIGSGVDELKGAIDVLEGKAASVGSDGALAGTVPPGTTVLFRVNGLSTADLPCKDPLVKQTESYRFVTGEYQGQSFFRSRSVMTNTEVVGQVNRVLDGVRALGEIHVGQNPAGKRLVDGLKVKAEEKTLTVLWSGSADDVYGMIELHAKFFEEHVAKMRAKHGWKRGHDGKKGEPKKDGPKKDKPASDEDF